VAKRITTQTSSPTGSPEKNIDRRKLLKGAGLIGAASVLSACDAGGQNETAGAPAIISKKRRLKMVTTWPKNFPGLGTGAARLARRIEDLSDGNISIKLYAGGELVGPLEAFDAVSQGKADMYHGGEYYWQGKSPAFNFFCTVPMGMTAPEITSWIRFGGGQELWDELSGKFNIKAFLGGNSGTQMGGWFNREINSIEDFQGLRIRMPGLGGEVIKRVGATPVTKAGGEIFQALSQGNIDATEWVGPWNDLAFGFYSIVKNYYYPGIHEPGTALSLGLNLDLWNDMSATEKTWVEAASAAENDIMLAEFNANNARALDTLINDHGVRLLRFSDEILERLGAISADVVAEAANHDELAKRVFDSYNAARTSSIGWGEIAEKAFMDARNLSFKSE
jgi:TRAP-type mannitol/chloroaromatic compound transport system substrate-binding protein